MCQRKNGVSKHVSKQVPASNKGVKIKVKAFYVSVNAIVDLCQRGSTFGVSLGEISGLLRRIPRTVEADTLHQLYEFTRNVFAG